MGIRLEKEELRIIELWFLSCEDMQLPNTGCQKCEFKEICQKLREKILYYIQIHRHLREEQWQFGGDN